MIWPKHNEWQQPDTNMAAKDLKQLALDGKLKGSDSGLHHQHPRGNNEWGGALEEGQTRMDLSIKKLEKRTETLENGQGYLQVNN